MIDYPDAVWNKQQLTEHLTHTANLFQSKVFKLNTPFTQQSLVRWIELIRAVSDLVRQTLLTGKRIGFTDEVNSLDEQQDITSLLNSMRLSAYIVRPTTPAQHKLTIITPAFNYLYGTGRGHFANGVFFSCRYENELTFFIGQDRIYFYRHLTRAFMEARHYLQSLPLP